MGAFGDLLFNLTGQVDPRRKMAQALAGASQPNPNAVNLAGSVNPVNAEAGGVPPNATGYTANAPPQQPAAPPQPQAYTSAPDFSKMYLDLLNRQESSDAIDRGMGLLFAGFAHPQDRAGMVQAMSSGGSRADPASMITTLQNAQIQQGKIEARTQLLQAAPAIAKQLNMPIEQVIAAINSGAMDDIIKEQQKTTTLQASPLYKAQTASAQTEAELHRAQAAKEAADQALAEARTRGVPSEIAQREADARAADARAAEATANATKVPSAIEEQKARTDEAKARTADIPLTPDIKDYNFYAEQEKAAGRTPLSFAEFQKKYGGKATPKQGLQVTWRQQMGPDGKPVLDENGIPIMEGVQLSDVPGEEPQVVKGATIKAQRTDTGTGWTYINPYTGQPIGAPISKNVEKTAEERASGAETGKAKADAERAFPGVESTMKYSVDILDQLDKHPGTDGLVGYRGKLPILPESDRANAEALRQQAVSTLYNMAVQSLRGITSRAALQEINNLAVMQGRLSNTNVSAEEYHKAIKEARESFRRVVAIAADAAGQTRPDWVKDVDLNAGPSAQKRWRRNPQTNKLEEY